MHCMLWRVCEDQKANQIQGILWGSPLIKKSACGATYKEQRLEVVGGDMMSFQQM